MPSALVHLRGGLRAFALFNAAFSDYISL